MLLETSNNKRLRQLELLHFSCHSLRETDWQTAVHTQAGRSEEQEVSAVGKVQHQSTASLQPTVPPKGPCWGPVWQVPVELLEVQMYSLRGRLPKGGHVTKGSIYVQLHFWKYASSRRIQGKVVFFNLFFFSHGSFSIGIKCPLRTVPLS